MIKILTSSSPLLPYRLIVRDFVVLKSSNIPSQLLSSMYCMYSFLATDGEVPPLSPAPHDKQPGSSHLSLIPESISCAFPQKK